MSSFFTGVALVIALLVGLVAAILAALYYLARDVWR